MHFIKKYIILYMYKYYTFLYFMYNAMKKQSKKLQGVAIEKQTPKKTLWSITLFDEQPLENVSNDLQFIIENQKQDLKKTSKLNLDRFSKELVFFDLFMKNNKVNKSILTKAIEYNKNKICKQFINEFLYVNTPNEKNYEKKLIEKITNKMIIENIENSYDKNDKKDIENIKSTLEKLNELKNEYRLKAYEKLNSVINIENQKQLAKDYRKTYQALIQKQLKSRYRLAKKYNFLVD